MARTTKPKQYICSWESCEKTFTRSDHLQRHVLNHNPGGSTCPRCSLHFKRPDLLERHLQRHRQKDEEAGAPGLGVIDSRKKLWKDDGGNIVSKRPAPPGASSVSKKQATAKVVDDARNEYQILGPIEPISPPQSMLSSESSEQMMHTLADMSSVGDVGVPLPGLDMLEFLANSTWGATSTQGNDTVSSGMPFDDTFNPDTASSFNMPFTTMANYNWLFDLDDNSHTQSDIRQMSDVPGMTNLTQSEQQSNHVNMCTNTFEMEPHSGTANPSSTGAFLRDTGWQSNQSEMQLPQDYHADNPMVNSADDPISWAWSLAAVQYHPQTQEDISQQSSGDQNIAVTGRFEDLASPPMSSKTPSEDETGRQSIPTIDCISHEKLLDLVEMIKPVDPTGAFIDRNHHLLTISCLQSYLDLYFSHFNRVYPLLHEPTFDPAQTQPLLLLAVLLLGASYGDKTAHTLAVCIHDGIRAQVFQHVSFTATPDLWIIQTILLVECFGKSRAGQKQHDMAHLFHGLLINLIRRSDCQTVSTPTPSPNPSNLEFEWHRAIDAEHRKRLAFFCFLWDTQHAVLFSQSLCMSSFELRTTLPCSQATWEAQCANEWYRLARQEKQIPFLAVLKAYVNPESHTQPRELDAVSRLLVLHGLMSIQWDMKRRDQASLGVAKSNFGLMKDQTTWQEGLAQSYEAWKADFDTFCMNMTLSLSPDSTQKAEFIRFSTATTAIYHAAHITLNVEILDLQIYAGARHILGRPVARADFERSRKMIQEWAKSSGCTPAAKAAWHAAQLLREGIMNLNNWDVSDTFHYPWCLYLSTLTCWAFHYANVTDKGRDTPSRAPNRTTQRPPVSNTTTSQQESRSSTDKDPNDRAMWHAKVEMNALVSSLTSVMPESLFRTLGRHSPSGLIEVMGKHLSNIRWAIVHEGVKVLKALNTDRLPCDQEPGPSR